ncbi:hypothetical protein [Azoarcus sp. KH32C]|uniref:hypothetical protein n=1 Tax=Azoarcus sp. KH32C TaxID=748247 RepID=UPI00023866F1|nr:hypothetical protein [Azoarcus sp. KH32C]BAL23691.1 hypothetical protein AZKH_1369 [Azoarcus sp. KH32C]
MPMQANSSETQDYQSTHIFNLIFNDNDEANPLLYDNWNLKESITICPRGFETLLADKIASVTEETTRATLSMEVASNSVLAALYREHQERFPTYRAAVGFEDNEYACRLTSREQAHLPDAELIAAALAEAISVGIVNPDPKAIDEDLCQLTIEQFMDEIKICQWRD